MSDETPAQRQFHVLAVEDEAPNLHLIAATLQGHYKVSVAKTVSKARELLSTLSIDILLLDINLPDGNGTDLCQEVISRTDLYGEVQVVFMTGMTSADDEVKGLNLGAADYIHKPLNSAVLFARVRLQAQLIRRNELLANLARIDGLTEIPNRRAFDDWLKSEWFRAKRNNTCIALGMIDVDHFKLFNDYYGHPAGDTCLQDVAQLLKKTFLRGSDFVARYGGEEFAVILPATDLATATNLFDRAMENLEALAIPHEGSPVKPFVTISAGVSCANPQVDSPQRFVMHADELLYQAKHQGRARMVGQNMSADV